MGRRICRWTANVFLALCLAALAILLVGTYGLFGQERDALAGVYVVLLGLPWVWLSDLAPEAARPWVALATPFVNVAILRALCARFAA
jgi:hypothetical protein